MGFNMVQKTFICDSYLKSYARLNALNTENVNAINPGSKFSFTINEMITCFKILPFFPYRIRPN